MKHFCWVLTFAAAFLFHKEKTVFTDNDHTVNPILGDISFVKKFGHLPDSATDEVLRIKTHFEYVENLLRQKDVSYLPPELQVKRGKLLDLLHQYAAAGIFPHNYDHPEKRVPCFIDKNGNICAVGFLIEKTAGREIAEEINRKHQDQKIFEMNDSEVDDWIASSGLTKEECAMIQPTYQQQEVAFSVGTSYRAGDAFYPTIDLSSQIYHYKTGYTEFNGIGIRADYLMKQNFEIGPRVFFEMCPNRSFLITPVLGLSPILYHYYKTFGMNFKPEVEFILAGTSAYSLHLSYGYDVPVIAQSKFGAGRNDITLRVQVDVSRVAQFKGGKQRSVW
ncbi:MAG TPA: hypothetical protein VL651_12795 [Bacteroidia bacterium]|jgi:hypothetical protein|nr:hypothetical protein [Bacteroidia bacterium]